MTRTTAYPCLCPRVAVSKVLSREQKTTSEIQTVRAGPGPQIHTFISWYLVLRLLGETPLPLLLPYSFPLSKIVT